MTNGITTRRIAVAAITTCFLCCATAGARGPNKTGGGGYLITPFDGGDPGALGSNCIDLNEVNEAIGSVQHVSNQYQMWHLDLVSGVYTPLPHPAMAINNLGQIVGYTVDEDDHPDLGYYLSGLGAVPMALPPLDGYANSKAVNINDAGIIVGYCMNTGTDDPETAAAWRPVINADGTLVIDGPVPLSPLDGDGSSSADDVNDPLVGSFQIVGNSNHNHAVIWTIDLNEDGTLAEPAAAIYLEPLDGVWTWTALWYGLGNNDLGDVCGSAGPYPVIRPSGGGAQALEIVRNGEFGRAVDINELGQVVGIIEVSEGKRKTNVAVQYGYLWQGFGADPTRLDALIGNQTDWDKLGTPNSINNSGAIAGTGIYNGKSRGFIMWKNGE